MPEPIRFSATLIVRDEEAFLEGCLLSISGKVDEIVVVDTGSVDRTRDIARDFGATLIEREWRNDFAWARNEAIAAATGDWLLYIDADERLTLPEGTTIASGLDGDNVFAGRVQFRPTVNATPYRELRLFRNDPRLRFRGSMHETLLPDLDRLVKENGVRVAPSPAEIVHLGYEGDLTRKHKRNLPLLRAAIAANPDRTYYWHDLARTLSGLGEVEEALATARQGMALARTRSSPIEHAIGSMMALTVATLEHTAGGNALPTIEAGLALYPRQPSLQHFRARILVERGEPEQAIAVLDALIATGEAGGTDPNIAFDRRIFGEYAHELRAIALLKLGRKQEAGRAFAMASALAPDNLSYRVRAVALGGLPAASQREIPIEKS
ncbi:MAG: glycosyltransferase [Devosia sp.]